ncbi:MAG: hypothetical protein ABJC36_11745 [Gemmatimonadales bacterium]
MALMVIGACGDSQAPSLSGPSFVAGTIDGRSWRADTAPLDLYALLGPQRVILSARRHTEQPAAEEVLGIEFETTDIFAERNYPLAGTLTGIATFRVTTLPPGGPTQAFYSTMQQHTGTLIIEASDPVDSVVTGSFGFEAGPFTESPEVHHVTGRFRVRYTTHVP